MTASLAGRRPPAPTRARSPPPTATGGWRTSSTGCRSMRVPEAGAGDVPVVARERQRRRRARPQIDARRRRPAWTPSSPSTAKAATRSSRSGEGDLVEVTSTDRAAARPVRLPRRRGRAGRAAAARELARLGADRPHRARARPDRAPLGGRADAAGTAQTALEDGIQVRFGAGDFRVGDHWLIPARTVRLVYGVSALVGHDRVAGRRDRRAARPAAAGAAAPAQHASRCSIARAARWTVAVGLPPAVPAADVAGDDRPARR